MSSCQPTDIHPSRWQTLLLWVTSSWHDPDASAEQNAKFRGRQYHFVMQLAPMSVIPSICLLMAGAWWFWQVGDRTAMVSLFGAQILSGSITLEMSRRRSRQPRDALVSDFAATVLALNLGVAAIVWSVLTAHLFAACNLDQRVVLLSVIGAVLTCGSWFYAVMPQLGLAWTFSMGFGLVIGLGLTQWQEYPALPLLLLFYMVVLIWTVLISSRLFMNSLITEQALEHQRQLVGLLLNDFEENASDWLWEIGPTGKLHYVSVRLTQILNQTAHAIQQRTLVNLLAEIAPASTDAAQSPHHLLADVLAKNMPFRDLTVPVQLNGQRRWWALSAKPLRDAGRAVVGWRGVGSDVTIVREHTLELTRLATIDPLTGLANRHQFNQQLTAHFATPTKGAHCMLLLLDLDQFKNVNDTLGHVAGDTLLYEVGLRLKANIDEGTLLARLGGDEFALLVEGTVDREGIRALGTRLQNALRLPCVIEGQRLEIQASIGVGLAPADGASATALLKASDMALHAAKAAGRNTLCLYEAHMAAAAQDRMDLLAEMREGLERAQFVVHYQPQVDLHSGNLLGFEALVRWQHPTLGLVPPARFIPVAEESGLILLLGPWVLKQACRDAVTWPGNLRVAVNISAVEFDRTDVLQSVTDALHQSGLASNRLEIELTESTLLQDSESLILVLAALRRVGVRSSLDDFGTGFSSLAYLRRFPLDQLKIDQSFVKPLGSADDLGGDRNAEAIVQAIHGLAQALGMETTAEGVETAQQQQALQRIGCQVGQGYFFARPMCRHQVADFIQARAG